VEHRFLDGCEKEVRAMDISTTIQELRRSRGLSAAALAERARISRGHLHGVENRSFTPRLRTLEKISAAFGLGLGRFLTLNHNEITLEDEFIKKIAPLLPRLNSQQREAVLRTLAAAPKSFFLR
jgi:transcriptional regulator with XRE-family HTH domain